MGMGIADTRFLNFSASIILQLALATYILSLEKEALFLSWPWPTKKQASGLLFTFNNLLEL